MMASDKFYRGKELEVGKIYCLIKGMASPYGWDVTNHQPDTRLPSGMNGIKFTFDGTAAFVFMGRLLDPYGNRQLYSFMGRKADSQQGDEVVILAFETFVVECLMKEVL